MLNREICKKCIDDNTENKFDPWSSSDDEFWDNHGEIECIPNQITPVREKPPEWCLHKLEQAVAAGMSDA